MDLKNIFLFENIDNESLKEIEKFSKVVNLNKNEIVFYENEPSDYLHIVIKGSVKIYKFDSKGNEVIIHKFVAPSMVAERANLLDMQFPANCAMDEDGTILKVNFKQFKNSMQKADICFKIMQSLLKKMNFLENVIHSNLILDVQTKIAKFIYEETEAFETLKQHSIATLLNIKPETLSRKLKKLKELGIIENQHSKLKVINKEKLKEIYKF
jgi:CRP/FNR family transcriptional regulator